MSVVLIVSANPSCLSATHRAGHLHALFCEGVRRHPCQHQQQVALPGPCHGHTYKYRHPSERLWVRFQTTEIKRISQPKLLHHNSLKESSVSGHLSCFQGFHSLDTPAGVHTAP